MTFRWFGRDDPIPLTHIRQIPGVDPEDGEIELAIPGVDFTDLIAFAIGQLHRDGPGFTDHMQAGGDEAIARDDETGAHTPFLPIPAEVRDDDD